MGSCKDNGANIRNVEVGFMGLEGSGFVRAVTFTEYLLPTSYRENVLQGHRAEQAQLLLQVTPREAATGALPISSE